MQHVLEEGDALSLSHTPLLFTLHQRADLRHSCVSICTFVPVKQVNWVYLRSPRVVRGVRCICTFVTVKQVNWVYLRSQRVVRGVCRHFDLLHFVRLVLSHARDCFGQRFIILPDALRAAFFFCLASRLH
jgi:hypothetical protein